MAITGKDSGVDNYYVMPARTPGPLGTNDAGDPTVTAYIGNTPGALGLNDGAGDVAETGRHRIRQGIYSTATKYIIPSPRSGTPPLISDQDFAKAGDALGVEAAAIYAVCKVESGGRTGFDSKGRPKILFEAKWFHKFSGGRYDCSHPHLSQPSWEGARRYYRDDQWGRLIEGSKLDMEAALKSASWGKFQIMGFNHNGYSNVFLFCDAMFISEVEHLRSFIAYCQDNHLIQFLKARNWGKFAERYNGSEYKRNHYDEKLERAYKEYQQRELGVKIWV